MASIPPVFFFLADERTPVRPGGRLWEAPLPLDRHVSAAADPQPDRLAGIRYGDYFTAAADFLRRQGPGPLAEAAAKCADRPVTPADIRQIRIYLEKHGAFYHPSQVVLRLAETAVPLVLNVALSEAGRRGIADEFARLTRLSEVNPRWLPQVFFLGSGKTDRGDRHPMFLGRWFDGFCEFHLTEDGSRTAIWNPERGAVLLSAGQRREIYRGVARILGDYYQLSTGARIHPWHHAAGDFIARIDKGGIALRLITVRGYPPALPHPAKDAEPMLREMLVAFLHLSVRTRMDRADGTGELLWADADAVEPTLVGFAEALADKPPVPGISEPASMLFLELLGALPPLALTRLAEASLEGFGPEPAEAAFARRRMESHLQELQTAVHAFFTPPACSE